VYSRPDIDIVRNYKTKEVAVAEFVAAQFPDASWTTDKTIAGGCSRRRPDIFADFGSHVVIVEVDEHQHDSYDCECHHRRIMEISKDVAHRPVVFIRFNPDAYERVTDGVKVTSCWGAATATGIMCVRKSKVAEWAARVDALRQQLAYWTANVPEKTVEVVELFYA
jgi:hypothetical protein